MSNTKQQEAETSDNSMLQDIQEGETRGSPKQRNLIEIGGFLAFAVVTYIMYTSFIISAQDILASTDIPTSSTILCLNLPYFIMTLFVPYFIDKMSLMAKAMASLTFFAIGILVAALINTPRLRLIGVVVASLGMGTAEIGFLSATSLHEDLTIHSFTTGTGLGAVLGTGFFTAMTTLFCVNPKTTLLSLLVILPLYPLISWLITRDDNDNIIKNGSNVQYTHVDDGSEAQEIHQTLTWKEKLVAAKDNMYLAVPLFIGLFADYAIMQAVVTTIAFSNSPFDPRDHYLYYTLVFWIGESLGRSYGLVISWFKPNCKVVTKRTWILTAVLVVIFIFLILSSWYRFLSGFIPVLLCMFVTGASEGALYLNTFAVAGKDMQPRYKEFSRAFLTAALQGGILTVGAVGWWLEHSLREHCQNVVWDRRYCFTRSMHGWNSSASCLLKNH